MKLFYTILVIAFLNHASLLKAQDNVAISVDLSTRVASMSNGIISITINSKGQVNSLIYNNKDLINSSHGGVFYFSYNDQNDYYNLDPNSVRIEQQTDDYAEIVYSNTTGTLQREQAFIMLKGVSGIYSYVTIKGTSTEIKLREMRVVYRVSPSLFTYGYVTDAMQGELPSIADMIAVNDNPIMDATYLMPDGSVYTKYNWANYVVEDSVHGLMSSSEGVWAINPSCEYLNGGPMKQELTVHTTNKTPLALQMLQGEHFGASAQYFSSGDEKIYGPFFIYVNSGNSHDEMIEDAKEQASLQKSLWPYQWLTNDLYPLDRSTVTGKINIPVGLSSQNIQVVLAQPGADLYNQGKDYLFWSLTNANGEFTIPNVRQGEYTLYAYATEGEITTEFSMNNVTVSGSEINLGTIEWTPVKYDTKLWQIGENDRKTTGFNISDSLRAYGLYEYPPANLTFTIGSSNEATDWYYAQTKEGTWTISFNNDKTYSYSDLLHLTVSIAGASSSPSIDLYINDVKKDVWSFGNDGAVYRSAVLGGRHQVKKLDVRATNLKTGINTIKFKMTNVGSRGGLMYDCVKLEVGDQITGLNQAESTKDNIEVNCTPNPFKSNCTFNITLNQTMRGSLEIYNLQGQLVEVIFKGTLYTGMNSVEWKNPSLAEGIFIYKLATEHGTVTGKIQKVNHQ